MKDRRVRARRLTTALLSLLCAALAGELYAEATQPLLATLPTPSPSEREQAAPPDPAFVMPPLSAYAEVVARPLFSPTRRPDHEATAVHPADFTLIGAIISPRDRHALLSHGLPPKIERVAQGQTINGWTVQSIETDRVILVQNGQTAEIDASVKPSAPPQPHYRLGTEPMANGGD